MAYWLVKSEPEVYAWQDFERDGKTHWDGVRNHQAANNLRAMAKGDQVFFYHSNEGREIVGIAEVIRTAYPDPSDETGKFVMVDLKPVQKLAEPLTLAAMKTSAKLKNMSLIRQSRLSVSPVSADEWREILRMAGS